MGTDGKAKVFIGNLDWDLSEDRILDELKKAGKVVKWVYQTDPETKRPLGYAFATFEHKEEAETAIRNIHGKMLGSRPLKVDWPTSGANKQKQNQQNRHQQGHLQQYHNQNPSQIHNQPQSHPQHHNQYQQHSTTMDHQYQDYNPPQQQPQHPPVAPVPSEAGRDIEPHLKAEDVISQTLSALPSHQLLDILLQIQDLAINDPGKAQILLDQAPQITYAVFQALLLLGVVDEATLRALIIQAQTQPSAAAIPRQFTPQQPPLPQSYPQQQAAQQPLPSHLYQPVAAANAAPVPQQYAQYPGYAPQQANPISLLSAPVAGGTPLSLTPVPSGGQQPLAYAPAPVRPVAPGTPVPTGTLGGAPSGAAQVSQTELIKRVMSMTKEQIEQFPPMEREQLIKLKARIARGEIQ